MFGGRAGAEVEAQREHQDDDEDSGEEPERRADAEGLGRERGEERSQDEARDVERGDASEVGADMFGVAGDHDPANGGPDDAATEAEQESCQEEGPELGRDRTGDHRESGDDDTATHHERDVAAVGIAGEEELGEEAGEEARGDDESELGAGEAEAIAQVGEQRVDGAVAERHAAGDDAVGEQGASPDHRGAATRCATACRFRGKSLRRAVSAQWSCGSVRSRYSISPLNSLMSSFISSGISACSPLRASSSVVKYATSMQESGPVQMRRPPMMSGR